MSIQNLQNQSPFADTLNQTNLSKIGINPQQNAVQEKSKKSDPQDAFLTLFLTQLKNQNPMDPKDSSEFLSQIAQFNQVSGINKLNTSFDRFNQQFSSQKALEATAMVGHTVQVPSSFGILKPVGVERDTQTGIENTVKSMKGSVILPVNVPDLKVVIETPQGSIIKQMDLGPKTRGEETFSWDGTDQSGQLLPDGPYVIKAMGQISGQNVQMETRMYFPVESVTLGGSETDDVMVNLGSHLLWDPDAGSETRRELSLPLSQVTKVQA